MSIILNEINWAQEMNNCAQPVLGKKPFETLSRMAKYYKHEGMTKNAARDAIDVFLLRCDPDANTVSWSDSLDRAIKNGYKYNAIELDSIGVSATEMEKVDSLSAKQIRRLAFTLLCLCKYWNALKPGNNNWVRTSDTDIMRMANIHTSVKRQCALFRELSNLGYIKFSRQVDNLNVQVLFMDDGEAVLNIHNFDNLGYQYLKYHGDPYYYECCNCGVTEKRKDLSSRPRKYCPTCSGIIKAKQTAESDKRRYVRSISGIPS